MLVFESQTILGTYKDLWSCKLEPNIPVDFQSSTRAVITNVTLGLTLASKNERTTLMIRLQSEAEAEVAGQDEEENEPENSFAICNLLPGRSENHSCEVPLSARRVYVLTAVGPNPIDLLGYFIDEEEGHNEVNDASEEAADNGESASPSKSTLKRGRPDEEPMKGSPSSKQTKAAQEGSPDSKRFKLEALYQASQRKDKAYTWSR